MARRYKITREYFIPSDAEEVRDTEARAVVYLYEFGDKPAAMGFGGKRQRPDWHNTFRTDGARAEYVNRYFTAQREILAMKAESRKAQKEFETSLVVGDILYTSWGYDQTNVDFFQVVEVKSTKTVVIRPITCTLEGTGFVSGKVTPAKDEFTGPPVTKRVRKGDRITISKVETAWPWDGRPKHCSWGH